PTREAEPGSPVIRGAAVELFIDGDKVEARGGDDVLTASIRAGKVPAGCLCLAGDCPNCLAVVDGVAYVRMCRTPARAGMDVRPFPVSEHPPMPDVDAPPHSYRNVPPDGVAVGLGHTA